MKKIPSAIEDYLKAIYALQQASGLATTGTLSKALGNITPASVTDMILKLVNKGLVQHKPYHGFWLTQAGHRAAHQVMARHAVIEHFLIACMGFSSDLAYAEVERMEHIVSDAFLMQMEKKVQVNDAIQK